MAVLTDDGGGVSFLAGVVAATAATCQLADGRSEDEFDPTRVVGHCGEIEQRKEQSEMEGERQTVERTGHASGPHGSLITASQSLHEAQTRCECVTQQH